MDRGGTCAQAFAIVLKGRMRAGRTRADPNDPTRYRFDAATALLHVRSSAFPSALQDTMRGLGMRERAAAAHRLRAAASAGGAVWLPAITKPSEQILIRA